MTRVEDEPKRRSKWRWIVGIIVVLVVMIALVALTRPLVVRAYVDPLSREWGALNSMRYELPFYASSNDGRFPTRLDDLAALEDGYRLQKFRDFRTGKFFDWNYFPGFGSDDRGDTILLAAPLAFSRADGTFRAEDGPSRMILTLDGRVLILAERNIMIASPSNRRVTGGRRRRYPPGILGGF